MFVCFDVSKARNDMICLWCRSASRNRHVARVVLSLAGGGCARALGDLARCAASLRIYHTHVGDPIARHLQAHPGFVCSAWMPDVPAGMALGERASCQNLEALTYEAGAFDLAISEDVFEHVRDDKRGFAEVFRVLKPGGSHVFTVPCLFDEPTIMRVDTSGPEDRHLVHAEYHGDPVRGCILAYRNYGLDLFDLLSGIGFRTRVEFSRYADERFGIVESYVFVSTKPEA